MRTRSTVLGAGRRVGAITALSLALGLSGCDSLFEVDNPNNVSAEDLTNPVSAPSIVSGAVSSVARAWGSVLTTISTASDELVFVGSRDSWQQLDNGDLSDPTNEFTDAAFPLMGEARWLADTAIRLLEYFDGNGDLADRALLARAYLNAAIIYAAIGDWFDDFPIFSNGMVALPGPGPDNIAVVYDSATNYLSRGLAVAQDVGDTDLEAAILAMRASVAHRRAVWELLNPVPGGTGLVGVDAAAVADANAALAIVGADTDWAFYHSYSPTTVGNTIGAWSNERADLRVDVRYAYPTGGLATAQSVDSVALEDPIDGVTDPAVSQIMAEFAGGFGANPPNQDDGPLRVVSTRELLLLLAEDAAADGLTVQAVGFINQYRALNPALTPYTPAVHPQTVEEMIEYHRSAALFLQGRRLADMYRFGVIDPEWQATSEAVTRPGTFLPITQIECNANPGAC